MRRLFKEDFDRAFEQVDAVLGPTSPQPAFGIGEKAADPLAMYMSDIFTIPCNLAGICGISIPSGFSRSGLPIGVQLMAKHWADATLLRAAASFQSATDHHLRTP